MKPNDQLNAVKAVAAILILGIGFVVFYKFTSNQQYFMDDVLALRNYVMFTIVGMGFLLGLLYLVGQTTHKSKSVSKSSKSKSKKKK